MTDLAPASQTTKPRGLETHITDVANVLTYDDLRDVVLVGHSSSGAVITGVADRAPERLAQVVYLDAFVPEDGQSLVDLLAPKRRQAFENFVKTEGKGWLVLRFAPPPWETIVRDMWGVRDDADVKWMARRRSCRVLTFAVRSFRARGSTSMPRWRRRLRGGGSGSWRRRTIRSSRCQMR